MMLPVKKVADLELAHPAGASNDRKVEAASGLAILERTVYVIADDEVYIAIFREMGGAEGETTRLLDVEVSSDRKERKRHKPDLESLTPLSTFGEFEHGGLLALGSGSAAERHWAAFAELDGSGAIANVIQLDAGPLMKELEGRVPKLNLEGTAVTGDDFRVLQRGNDPEATNAHIDLDLNGVCEAISNRAPLGGNLVKDIKEHDLGQIRGTKLCFSDADTLPDGRIVFSASAESSGEGIDGQPMGTSIGVMTPDGDVLAMEPIELETKVEGLAAKVEDGEVAAYMVTDNDDPDQSTALLRTILPIEI